MATTLKVLGQKAPNAASETDLYAPSGVSVVASSLVVCNRAASPSTFRVSISVGGGGTATKDYLYYDLTIDGNNTFAATLGITLTSTDIMRVYSSTANLTFTLYGQENS
jgi:hypothetical protein